MSKSVTFTLDGNVVTAAPGETLFDVARHHGTELPHLCHRDAPGYGADGNCRACLVEIEGERTLAPSCKRTPTDGMVVLTESARAETARKMVLELLLADQPPRKSAHDKDSQLWRWLDKAGLATSRFPSRKTLPEPDRSHPAMAVHLDACIHCGLCVRACRDVQVNDVIGFRGRGPDTKIFFDQDDALGQSTCVACGECVQACPTGALLPAALVDDAGRGVSKGDTTVASLCPFCGVGCQLTYHVNNGKIAWVEGRDGPANENRLCVKGRFGFDYIHHPHRLTRPLIRLADVSKDPNVAFDPSNPYKQFREASWEEALSVAAHGFLSLLGGHGASSVAGFGSAKGSNEEAYLVQKLVRTGFHNNNVDHCTRLCHASSVAALMEGIGSGAVTAPFTAAEDADVIIVIGARPAQNHPVAATYIKNAKKRGATLIVMDPRKQGLTRHADIMVQFKPGRDVALLNAMINVIIADGLVNQDYVENHTEDYQILVEHIADYTPEKMAPVCGIDAATIRRVARTYAQAKRGLIYWGMGVAQHSHGTDNVRALIALALLTGHIGKPGTGLHPLRGQNNVQGASDVGLIPIVLPDYKSATDAKWAKTYGEYWGTPLSMEPGLTVVEIMQAILADDIRGLYVMGENPAMSDPDANKTRRALARLDHLVVQDIFLTETAHLADVVLPASAHAEKAGTFTNSNRQVQMGRPAVRPPGDARQDWWIIQEIARRMGLDWSYSGPEDIYAEMRGIMASIKGISWARLEREDCVTYPCAEEDQPGRAILFGDGFPTASGKGKFVPASGIEPDEMPDDDYPLVLTTGRLLEHWHTGAITRHAPTLNAIEPEATASLHPRQLKALGVEAGETIQVTSRRGVVTLAARADTAVPEGMVFIPFCFTEAAANLLTNPKLDPWGKIPELKYCAVKVEKT